MLEMCHIQIFLRVSLMEGNMQIQATNTLSFFFIISYNHPCIIIIIINII